MSRFRRHFYVKNFKKVEEMPDQRTLRAGVGAKYEVRLKHLHPTLLIKQKYPSCEHGKRLKDCVLIEMDEVMVNRCP